MKKTLNQQKISTEAKNALIKKILSDIMSIENVLYLFFFL